MEKYDYKLASNVIFVIGIVACVVIICLTAITIALAYVP